MDCGHPSAPTALAHGYGGITSSQRVQMGTLHIADRQRAAERSRQRTTIDDAVYFHALEVWAELLFKPLAAPRFHASRSHCQLHRKRELQLPVTTPVVGAGVASIRLHVLKSLANSLKRTMLPKLSQTGRNFRPDLILLDIMMPNVVNNETSS